MNQTEKFTLTVDQIYELDHETVKLIFNQIENDFVKSFGARCLVDGCIQNGLPFLCSVHQWSKSR